MFKVNEQRLGKYALAAQEWTRNWTQLRTRIAGLPLRQSHEIVVENAQILPQQVIQIMFHFSDTDQFLSEEDLDIGNLDWPERIAVWNAWLLQMQSTNEHDKDDYSHGVFLSEKQKRELWGDDWETEIKLATESTEELREE